MKNFLFGLLLLTVFCGLIVAQSTKSFIPVNFKKAYENQTRSINGKPGEKYWQNHSDYKIAVELIPEKFLIKGTETIIYKNNSPNKLFNLNVRLYQDVFRKGVERDIEINSEDINDGTIITKIIINGKPVDLDPKKPRAPRRQGTNMFVLLPEPMESNSEIKLEIDWSFNIPQKTRLRMGVYSPSTFFIAYWYPQIAVYDDTDGWDTHINKGTTNFYHDFNNYDVEITVPEKYTVFATGVLQNEKDNFSNDVLNRINEARTPGKTVRIVTKEDIEKNNVTRGGSKLKYHFIAEDVTDFAFAAGGEMLWDASTLKLPDNRNVFISAICPQNTTGFDDIINYTVKSIEYFSTIMPAVPYPYPIMTTFNFNGGGGMEYPMMTNDGIGQSKQGNAGLTAHEVSHTYMPFLTGINERKYAWMDEGWASWFTRGASRYIIPPDEKAARRDMPLPSSSLGQEDDMPLFVNSNIMAGDRSAYATASYSKASTMLEMLKNAIGADLFKKALQEFINRWRGKHPIPYDFFYTFNDVAGENLDWFWIPWIFERGYGELAIKNVTPNDGTYTTVIYREGILPLPVYLKYTFEDGSTAIVEKPASVWKEGIRDFQVIYKTDKKVAKIELGNSDIPDTDRSNNIYELIKNTTEQTSK